MSTLEEIISKMEKILSRDNVVEGRHSFFQLQHFVINAEPTTQSRMWQCIREMRKRNREIKQITMEIEETQDNITILDLEIKKLDIKNESLLLEESATSKVDKELNSVKKRQLERRKIAQQELIKNLETSKQERLDEAVLFVRSFEALERIEPLKPFDDPDSQREYWNGKLTNELNWKLLLQQPIDIEMAKTIKALPNGIPIKDSFMFLLDQTQKKISEKDKTKGKIEGK